MKKLFILLIISILGFSCCSGTNNSETYTNSADKNTTTKIHYRQISKRQKF